MELMSSWFKSREPNTADDMMERADVAGIQRGLMEFVAGGVHVEMRMDGAVLQSMLVRWQGVGWVTLH